MKVVTKNEEELKVKEIHVLDKDNLTKILLPHQIKRVIIEDIDKDKNDLKNYEIKRIGKLSLCLKDYKNSKETDIDISKWIDDNFKHRYVIASFEPDYDDGDLIGYELHAIRG